MEAEGMKQKDFRYQHCFNGDAEKRGPILIIEVCFDVNGPGTGAYIAHKWSGTGNATRKEIDLLKKDLKRRDFKLIHDYLEIALPG